MFEFSRKKLISSASAMILILEPNARPRKHRIHGPDRAARPPSGIQYRVHREVGAEVTLTEIYLIGNTGALTLEQMQVLPSVQKVVRVSEAYRVLGRHQQGDDRPVIVRLQRRHASARTA